MWSGVYWPLSALVLLLLLSVSAAGLDWPHWRGPNYDGISKETGWSTAWPAGGPRPLWKASVGTGFSSFSVAQGRAYTMGNTDDKETIFCFDAATGREVWKHTYDCELDPLYYEGGPSATPTVDGSRVYTLSRKGHLFCLDAATGAVQWHKRISRELGMTIFKQQLPEWGFAGSPLVQGDLLVVNVGEAGAAVEKLTGKVVWSTARKLSGYSTPVPFESDGQRALAIFGAEQVFALALKDGRKLWEFPWKTSYDVNAADPVIAGNKVFISSGYGRGAALLKISGGKVEKLWENKHLRNQFNSSVLLGGHLYGFDDNHGSRNASLRCLEFETGALKWTEPGVKPGGLMAADGKLVILGEKGELVVAAASPEAFKPLARAQILGGKCWTVPVLSHGRVYARNARGEVVCVDVRGGAGAAAP